MPRSNMCQQHKSRDFFSPNNFLFFILKKRERFCCINPTAQSQHIDIFDASRIYKESFPSTNIFSWPLESSFHDLWWLEHCSDKNKDREGKKKEHYILNSPLDLWGKTFYFCNPIFIGPFLHFILLKSKWGPPELLFNIFRY